MKLDTYDYKDFINSTLCVIVIYKVKLIDSLSFKTLLKILNETNISLDILIYDNSPSSEYDVNKESYQNTFIHYVHNAENGGVSKAYNEGFKLAKKQNKKWLLLMDQDTICPDFFLENYYKSILKFPNISLFAPKLISQKKILSPCNFFLGRGSAKPYIVKGLHNFKRKSLLNSGILIKLEAFELVGGYNNNIKLDFSDFFFIDNYKKSFNSFVITDTECSHDLSSNDTNIESLTNRFGFYCNGARHYANFKNFFWISFWCILRMIKLTIRHKDTRFITIFFKYYILNTKK